VIDEARRRIGRPGKGDYGCPVPATDQGTNPFRAQGAPIRRATTLAGVVQSSL